MGAQARRNALHLESPEFEIVLDRFSKIGPMIVMGLIEIDDGRLFNTGGRRGARHASLAAIARRIF